MLKQTLPKLISFQQTAYVKNTFLGEERRLTSDILEMSESLQLKGYIVIVYIEKALDSLSHSLSHKTKYFKHQKGVWQGDPTSL